MSGWAMRNPEANYSDWIEHCEQVAEERWKAERDNALEAVLEASARCRRQLAALKREPTE